jgi:hypothetical protein
MPEFGNYILMQGKKGSQGGSSNVESRHILKRRAVDIGHGVLFR